MPWKTSAVNKAFLETLRMTHPEGFSTHQAESLYISDHARPTRGYSDDYWKRVSARNAIAASAFYGHLVRVQRGKYVFPKEAK